MSSCNYCETPNCKLPCHNKPFEGICCDPCWTQFTEINAKLNAIIEYINNMSKGANWIKERAIKNEKNNR